MKKLILAFCLIFNFSFIFSQESKIEIQKYTLPSGEEFEMVKIPGKNYAIGRVEVPDCVYEAVMEETASNFGGEEFPADGMSWYDSVFFCNKLSILLNKTPVYSVNDSTNPDDWDYSPHGGTAIIGEITQNSEANGFRLPTEAEWEFAAKGGENFKYAGSDDLNEVAWFNENSKYSAHKSAQKKPNGYGIYDMSGNLWEWCWEKNSSRTRIHKGGSHSSAKELCEIGFQGSMIPSRNMPNYTHYVYGLRIVQTITQ